MKPYFLRSEGNEIFAGEHHGTEGPLGVSNLQTPQPITRAFVQSCQQFGIPYNPDFNGPVQEGTGIYQMTIRNARRCSAAVAYLRPALGRKNLIVQTGCLTNRILFSGSRSTGVEYRQNGQVRTARAAEIVVTAGAIGSPKIMMLSGIGPATHLEARGIEVVHDLPGVGQNLNDHFGVDIVYELKGPTSLDKYDKLHWMLWAGLQYMLFKTGPVTSNVVEGGAFWYSARSEPIPDLQFHFLAGAGVEAGVPAIPSGSGCTLNSYVLRPKSRGAVTLRSADPAEAGYSFVPSVVTWPAFRRGLLTKNLQGIHHARRTTLAHRSRWCRQFGLGAGQTPRNNGTPTSHQRSKDSCCRFE